MRVSTSRVSWRYRAVPLAIAAAVVLAVSAGPATAQNVDRQALLDRIQRLERDVRTLNIQIARGVSPQQAAKEAGAAAPAAASGDGGGDGNSPAVALLGQRVDQMDSDLRDVTGRMEEINHRLSLLEQRLDKLTSDVEFRFSRLEGGASGNAGAMSNGGAAGNGGLMANGGGMKAGPVTSQGTGGGPISSSAPDATAMLGGDSGGGAASGSTPSDSIASGRKASERSLGTISQQAIDQVRQEAAQNGGGQATAPAATASAAPSGGDSGLPDLPPLSGMDSGVSSGAATPPPSAQSSASSAPSQSAQPQAQQSQQQGAQQQANAAATNQPVELPSGSPSDQYKYAFDLLRQGRYQDAADAFKQFLEKHPDDQLASNARYWLGETHYVRADYVGAAETFLEAYSKAKKGPKAPDSLLKLGMSLAQLDKVSEACAAFSKVKSDYPDAPAGLRGTLEREMKKYKCGG